MANDRDVELLDRLDDDRPSACRGRPGHQPKIYPNFAALRALEAAERRRSYTLAAKEMCVTHSAVSHQIRHLETQLGATLFIRSKTQMLPTEACSRLVERLRRSLADIDRSLSAFRSGRDGFAPPLVLSVMADFANVWLIPRLDDFTRQHPAIGISLTLHNGVEPPDPSSVDLGIWHQRISAPGYRSTRLLEDDLIAVCRTDLFQQHRPYRPEIFSHLPLLRFALRSWKEFFSAANIAATEPTRGPIYNDAGALLSATLAGQGAALIRWRIADPYLRDGTLCQLGDTALPAHLEYYLTWPAGHRRAAAIATFHTWLTEMLQQAAFSNADARARG